ncbi:MAG TPA: hypothetical protein VME18_02080 [Acidobacteriaceae bacterium]|nr:hypothetical protein [Acidobacteriaceae bacterium]
MKDDAVFRIDTQPSPIVGEHSGGGNGEQDNPMPDVTRSAAALATSESGQDLLEYALIAAFVVLVALLSFSTFANSVTGDVSNDFNTLGGYL